MSEIIGKGTIKIQRYNLDGSLMQYGVTSYDDTVPVAPTCILGIHAQFTTMVGSGFTEGYALESLELMTNFVTVDFSGNLTMGFTNVEESETFQAFDFYAGLFPTNFAAEVVIKLHYIDKQTFARYTSFFKCKISEVYKPEHDVLYAGTKSWCEPEIINPHSYTYHSSEQAAPPPEIQKMGTISTKKQLDRIPTSGQPQGQPQGQTPAQPAPSGQTAPAKSCPQCGSQNPADNRFCATCGYNFFTQSQPQTPPQPAAPPPVQQPVSSTTPPQPQVVYVTPEAKKPGCATQTFGFLVSGGGVLVILYGLFNFMAYFTDASAGYNADPLFLIFGFACLIVGVIVIRFGNGLRKG